MNGDKTLTREGVASRARERRERLDTRQTGPILAEKLEHDLQLVKDREGDRPRSAGPMNQSPADDEVVAAPAASAWWMDPKILLLGAAALLILMRGKK
ncbi:MAG: hypothetical protein JKX86_08125 [Verrucomicrobiales bacterium]|nr:hypothetical protein [Verrucomicrobiales bacterium]